jgi:hypothetical protein
MRRLATMASGTAQLSTVELVKHTVRGLRTEDASDDIAVLAMRWEGAR